MAKNRGGNSGGNSGGNGGTGGPGNEDGLHVGNLCSACGGTAAPGQTYCDREACFEERAAGTGW